MPSSSKDKLFNPQDRKPSLQDLQTKMDKCQLEWDYKYKAGHSKPTAVVFPEKRDNVKPMFPKLSNR